MLRKLFGAGLDPDRGVAFLENFLPGQAWVLAGIGARKVHVKTFLPQTYGQAKSFIAEQLRHNRELRALMAAPRHLLTTAPMREDLHATRHIGIEVAEARKAEIEEFERQPAILLKGVASWIAVWRFIAPVHPDSADKAEAALATRYGAKRLNHFLPLPNLGGFRLVEFAKDRLSVPTDFWAVSAQDHSAERKRTSFSPAAAIKAEEIAWLWPEVAAKGALTLIAGQPGMGKSQIAIFIAATLSAGGIWPDGSRANIGSAILCETEDDPASVIRPRLEAAGADLNKIAFGPHLDLTRELDTLIAQADTMPDLQLLVLSPIGSFFGASSYDDVTMRARLKPLLDWAAKKQVAIVGLTHPPKQGSGDVFAGSDVYRKVARGAWSAVTDPDDDEPLIKRKRRLLIGAKANNAPDTLRLAYRIEGVTLPSGIKTSRVAWEADRRVSVRAGA